MKSFLLLFAAAIVGHAAILPGVIGPWKFVSRAPLEVKTNRALWDELGLQDSEQGIYQKGGISAKVETWRLADATASMGAFDYLLPSDARPIPALSSLTPYAAATGDGVLLAVGNYLVAIHGFVPAVEDAADLFRRLPRYEHSSLPVFQNFLPLHEVPNSERYVGGPEALKLFFPGVEPSAAGFHLGGEAVIADYGSGLRMALFSYPAPAMARDRAAELGKIPNALVKRSGPLVAFVLHPTDENAAEALLAKVRYQATVTTGEKPKSQRDNAGNLLLNVFYLIGILLALCLSSGLVFGLLRLLVRRSSTSGEAEEILALHLESR